MNNKVTQLSYVFLVIFCTALKSMQETDPMWNQTSSSTKALEIKKELITAWNLYKKSPLYYQQFKKTSKKALKILGHNQIYDQETSSVINPLLCAAHNGDYSYILYLLKLGIPLDPSPQDFIQILESNTSISPVQTTKKGKTFSKKQVIITLEFLL